MGDELTQAISRHIGNEYDEMFLEFLKRLSVKIELYYRYADDQNIAGWSIGRTMKFCQVDGTFKNKTAAEINDDIDKREDELKLQIQQWKRYLLKQILLGSTKS